MVEKKKNKKRAPISNEERRGSITLNVDRIMK